MVLKLKSIEKVGQCITVLLEGSTGLHHVNSDMRVGKIMCTCIGFKNSKRIPPYCYHCGLVHFLIEELFG